MKKKTKSKSRNDLFTLSERIGFWTTNIFCVIGIILNIYLFLKSYTMSLEKLNEKPIATITFKYRTAQRRFIERNLWDRLKNDSPVYNGDTIRTGDLSEATLHFTNGNIVNLTDNTMTQVFFSEDNTLQAFLSEGGITIDSTDAEQGALISYNGMEVDIAKGSSVSASDEGDGNNDFAVQVLSGTATVSSNGKTESIPEGEKSAFTKDGKTVTRKITVRSPAPNYKVLNHSEHEMEVPFSWKLDGLKRGSLTEIIFSTDSEFRNIVKQVDATSAISKKIALNSGTYYWKITATDNDPEKENASVSAAGKIQIAQSLPPRLIAPVKDFSYEYRMQKPAVRFIWTETEYASSYEVAVADNPGMNRPKYVQRTQFPSCIIGNLDDGKWYWKVTPYYSVTNVGLDAVSQTGTFSIDNRGQLKVPKLQFPAKGAFINTKNDNSRINFSWQPDKEASYYNFMIADNEQMRNPLVQQKTESNYCPLDISTSKITNGTWYWSVSTVDVEGNISERASSRSFVAVDGEIIQKLVYPPDNYEIATNLLSDLRFTWKSNLPFETRLQISRTDNFKSKVYDQKESDTFDSGINIPTGHYYWRIISIDADGKEFSTLPRLINVMAMLPAPELIIPTEEKKAYVRPETLYIFRWKKVSGADYYNFTLSADSSKDELLHLTLLENNELAVNMENYPNGKYHWMVQAFANERPLASRRSGRLSETDFEMKKIIPIKLLWPVNNDKIDGIAAIENPASVTWESVDELTSSTFVLRRASDGRIVNSTKNPEKEIKLPRLMSGSYTWTVNGISTDDIDISPSKIGTFTVLPVPPLDDVMTDQPERGQIFNAYYFLDTKKISFAWEPIEKATEYEIKIFGPDKKKIFETTTRETSFDLTDMSKLKRGTFTWTVKARRLLTDGTLLQESGITEENFEIDLPHLKTTSLKEGIYYGR